MAGSQGGAVSLDQLRQLGVTRRAAAYRAGQGQLHRVHRGVYAVGHRSTSQAGKLRAAALACGNGALISHGTAAAFWGLRDAWPQSIDVTVRTQAGRKIDGVRCRRCRYPSAEEIGGRDGVSCTTPARTLVDLAGLLGAGSLRRSVERAAVLRLLDLDALGAALQNGRGRRGIGTLRAIGEEWLTEDSTVPDLRSDFEALVLPRLLGLGLPRPACNERLQVDDYHLTVDFFWESQRFVVETDGEQVHGTRVAFQRDRKRDQILIAAGYRVTRVTWAQMTRELDDVVVRIGRGLGRDAHGRDAHG